MAVTFNQNAGEAYAIMALFGVSAQLVAKAKALDIKVTQSTPGQIKVTYGGTTHGLIPLKVQAITAAKAGTLGPSSKQQFTVLFEQALNAAITAALKANPTAVAHDIETASETQKIDPAAFAAGFKKKIAASTSTPVPSGKVKLADATAVYQKVFGTDESSTYRVFALFEGLNLAARLQNNKLSIRAEGPALLTHIPALQEFKMEKNGHYASAHYQVKDQSIVVKTLGAMVGRVGFPIAKSIADLQKFIGTQ